MGGIHNTNFDQEEKVAGAEKKRKPVCYIPFYCFVSLEALLITHPNAYKELG